jgi:hypothetical protein
VPCRGGGYGVGYSGDWLLGRPEVNNILFDLFKTFSNKFELIGLKDDLSMFENFQIKYIFAVNEIRNNFSH